jgi:hypothetical protein
MDDKTFQKLLDQNETVKQFTAVFLTPLSDVEGQVLYQLGLRSGNPLALMSTAYKVFKFFYERQ